MYKRVHGVDSVQRLLDGAFIPASPDNWDYQAYLRWRADGNEPLPADPLPEQDPLSAEAREIINALAPLTGVSADVLLDTLRRRLRGKL